MWANGCCNNSMLCITLVAVACIQKLASFSDCKINSELECTMILFIRKDYGLHRTTAHKSSCFTLVHPNTVNVHLVSREGLQLAGLPLIA